MVSQGDVETALRSVNDPEIPVSVWDLGLVAGIDVSGDAVRVKMTFTSLGCGCMDWILEDVKAAIERIEGVRSVEVEVVWNPAWTKERMTAKARSELAARGIQS